MESLTIRNIEKSIKDSLRLSAASKGLSMEEEVRQILKKYVLQKKAPWVLPRKYTNVLHPKGV